MDPSSKSDDRDPALRRLAASDDAHFRAIIILAVLFVLVTILVLPIVQKRRETGPRRPNCSNCLKQVALALYLYHEDYSVFPQAVVNDENGAPMHSWRVALLPYLKGQDIFDAYDFDQPWNSVHNMKVGERAPDCFRCWKCEGKSPASTNIMAVTGAKTCWPSSRAIRLGDIADGPDDTIQLISLPDTGIHWLQPVDFKIGDPRPAGRHGQGHAVAFADGSVGLLPGTHSIEPFATIAAGDSVDRQAIENVPR
ncbi:MAG: DUF1559 domain-containing protein [Pirellulaceae bacterium]|nr:DUF1559 domain-containing protein [Pirellulaceae bacterium]